MTTTFNDVFEKLLEDRQVEVAAIGAAAEGLRVSLSRRLSNYKRTMDSLGFLPDDMKNMSLSVTPLVKEEHGLTLSVGTRYTLKLKANRNSYQILEPITDIETTKVEDNNG